jgi:hypothetical protein
MTGISENDDGQVHVFLRLRNGFVALEALYIGVFGVYRQDSSLVSPLHKILDDGLTDGSVE